MTLCRNLNVSTQRLWKVDFLSFSGAGGSELQDAAFGYFITACVVISLSILSYILLPKLVRCPFIPSPRPEIQNMEHKHIMHHCSTSSSHSCQLSASLRNQISQTLVHPQLAPFKASWVSAKRLLFCLCFQEFFHFYQERNTKQISLEQNSISLMNRGTKSIF